VVVLPLACAAYSHSIPGAEGPALGYRDDLGVAVLGLHRVAINIPIQLRPSGDSLTSLEPLFGVVDSFI
jgi:hypothetical protein